MKLLTVHSNTAVASRVENLYFGRKFLITSRHSEPTSVEVLHLLRSVHDRLSTLSTLQASNLAYLSIYKLSVLDRNVLPLVCRAVQPVCIFTAHVSVSFRWFITLMGLQYNSDISMSFLFFFPSTFFPLVLFKQIYHLLPQKGFKRGERKDGQKNSW